MTLEFTVLVIACGLNIQIKAEFSRGNLFGDGIPDFPSFLTLAQEHGNFLDGKVLHVVLEVNVGVKPVPMIVALSTNFINPTSL